jgi:hypothetical protein
MNDFASARSVFVALLPLFGAHSPQVNPADLPEYIDPTETASRKRP